MADAKAAATAAPWWPGETRAACAFTFDMDAETSRAIQTSMNASPSNPVTEPS